MMESESSVNDQSTDGEAASSIDHHSNANTQLRRTKKSESRRDLDGSGSFRKKPKSQRRSASIEEEREQPSPHCNDQYLNLFNHIRDDELRFNNMHLETTQIGSVVWSALEKEKLFQALSRKSRVDVGGIVAAIETKSELETSAFLRLLEDAYQRRQVHGQGEANLLGYLDYPAAAEISGDCEAMLDRDANALTLYQDNLDRTMGEQEHGDLWLIDNAKAQALDKSFDETEAGNSPHASLANGASLLDGNIFNFSGWLSLTERIYMNPSNYASNSFPVAQPAQDQSPGITYDAFSDLHDLAVNHLRQVIQSSLFYAESRIRCVKNRGRAAMTIIRAQDVATAINILGVPEDRSQFWPKLARRNQIRVIAKPCRHIRPCGIFLSYDEIERQLEGTSAPTALMEPPPAAPQSLSSTRRTFRRNTSPMFFPSQQDAFHAPSPTESNRHQDSDLQSPDIEDLVIPEDDEDDCIETSDRINSLSHELQLYHDLGLEAPEEMRLNALAAQEAQGKQAKGDSISLREDRPVRVDWEDLRSRYAPKWELDAYTDASDLIA
jgi:RNA polymerase I-specific transcription initiation factor RRN5